MRACCVWGGGIPRHTKEVFRRAEGFLAVVLVADWAGRAAEVDADRTWRDSENVVDAPPPSRLPLDRELAVPRAGKVRGLASHSSSAAVFSLTFSCSVRMGDGVKARTHPQEEEATTYPPR